MKVPGIILCIPLAIVLITTCTTEDSTETPIPSSTTTSGPTYCKEVEGNCFWLRFSGMRVTYKNPTVFKTGPLTLYFINKSPTAAAVNLLRHTGDKTIQDMIDYIGEEPSTRHHPRWTQELGTWTEVAPGETYIWKGVLVPGIYTIGCARLDPLGVWFGGGFTVED